MGLDLWRQILIDRISMNISIDDNDTYSFAWGQMFGIHDIQKDLLPLGEITLKKDAYLTRISFYPEKNRKIADVEVGRRYQHRYIKLGLYPYKFQGDDFPNLKRFLRLLAPLDYERFFFNSRTSYIEIAVDSHTHPTYSFIPFREKTNHSFVYVDKSGAKGATYLGSLQSDSRFAIYDKAKHLAETAKVVSHNLHTRFEYRGRNINLIPADLSTKMQNPFEKLMIADFTIAHGLSTNPEWLKFLKKTEEFGSALALASLTKTAREVAMARLFAARAKWWNPQSHWQGFSKALARISP